MTTTTKKIELYDADGDFGGYLQCIRYDDGSAGWQNTDEDGTLYVVIDQHGRCADHPGDRGNCSWELCEETDAHRRSLANYLATYGGWTQ